MRKFQTGIKEIDNVLDGGFPSGTLTLIFSEGKLSGKTSTLSFVAKSVANSGNLIGYISFDESIRDINVKINNATSTVVSLESSTDFKTIETLLGAMRSDVVFIDNLTNLYSFTFTPEAVSVVHNLRTIAMYTQKAIVATVEVLPGQDVSALMRLTDIVFDIEQFQHNAFTLGVLKNRHGQSGFNINFGVSH